MGRYNRQGTETSEECEFMGWLEDIEEKDSTYHHCGNYTLCLDCNRCTWCCDGWHDPQADEADALPESFAVDGGISEG
jgi:hypothetical protein